MKIEISFDGEDEFDKQFLEKAKRIFEQIAGLRKSVRDSQPISDSASFELRGPDGEVKQREEGKSNATG